MDFGDRPTWVREGLFGGDGVVTVRDLAAGRSVMPFTAVLGCTLSPAGSVGVHVQDAYAEIVVGIKGSGEATVDGTPHRLAAGDVVHLPLGATLSLRNLDEDVPLHYLIVKSTG